MGLAWGERLQLRACIDAPAESFGEVQTPRHIRFSDLKGVHLGGVTLAGHQAPFGGTRWWLSCPGCGRSRRALYLLTTAAYSEAFLKASGDRIALEWKCRECARLVYPTQRLDPIERLRYRSRKIALRLGRGDASWHDYNRFLSKPKGMHWSSWQDLNAKLDQAESAFEHASVLRMRKFLGAILNTKGSRK